VLARVVRFATFEEQLARLCNFVQLDLRSVLFEFFERFLVNVNVLGIFEEHDVAHDGFGVVAQGGVPAAAPDTTRSCD